MELKKLLPIVLTLTLALSACSRPPAGEETPAPSPSAPPAETAAPETPAPAPEPQSPVWGEQTFSRTFTAGDGTALMQVNYVLPAVQNASQSPAGAVISAWYQAEGEARIREAEEEFETVVADYEVSAAMGYEFQPVLREMSSQVVYEDRGVISVRRELYASFGGAHPFVSRLSEQFDAATGSKLAFADFFADAEAVMGRVVSAFTAQDELSGLSQGEILAACQPENFYLTGDGYVFWIQGGSLPAVNSPIEVTIPFDQLSDLSAHG